MKRKVFQIYNSNKVSFRWRFNLDRRQISRHCLYFYLLIISTSIFSLFFFLQISFFNEHSNQTLLENSGSEYYSIFSFFPSIHTLDSQRYFRIDNKASKSSTVGSSEKELDLIIGIISGSNRLHQIVGCILTWVPLFRSERDKIIIFTDENVVDQVSEAIKKHIYSHETNHAISLSAYQKIENFKNYIEFVTLFGSDSSWLGSQNKPLLALYYITETYFLDTDNGMRINKEQLRRKKNFEAIESKEVKSSGKWALMVDDDTFVIPKNVRKLLLSSESQYDYKESLYLGRSMTCEISDENGAKRIHQFAHGGSGYVLSYGLLNLIHLELEKKIKEKYFPLSQITGKEEIAKVKPPGTKYSDCQLGGWLMDSFDILPFHENCFHAEGPEKYVNYFAMKKEKEGLLKLKDVHVNNVEEDYFANLQNPCTFHYAFGRGKRDNQTYDNIFSWNRKYNYL